MKFFAVPIAVPIFAAWLAASAFAQQPAAQPPAEQQPLPQEPIPTLPAEPEPPVPAGARVVASPAIDHAAAFGNAQPVARTVTAKASEDLHRDPITITAWDLDLLVRPATHNFAVRGQLTLRSDDAAPLNTVELQISSQLDWQAITLNGKRLTYTTANLDTGFDHTALSHEALITLPSPLAPGATLTLTVLYEGAITLNAARIEQLGAPPEIAEHTDWDRVSGDFTGVRGLGNVMWFPVSIAPAMLGDGARMFTALGEWKLRHQQSTMRLRVRVDTSADVDEAEHEAMTGAAPAIVVRPSYAMAILNGQRVPLTNAPGSESLLTGEAPSAPLGFAVPSLFLADGEAATAPGLHVYAEGGEQAAAQAYPTALALVRPVVEQWLPKQQRDMAVVSLPRDGDAAYATAAWWRVTEGGPLLATSMPPLSPEQVTPALANALARASFLSPRPWLSEGVPQLLSALWAAHANPDDSALELLESSRPALALAEPEGAASPGEPLISATDDIYFRVKAAYVLWMLRGICGDAALISALKTYNPAQDASPQYFERVLESAAHQDLGWFFADWVYNDRGLPDLSIANVVVSKLDTAGGSWLVTVDIANSGYAVADVPVRVDAGDRHESARVRIPARGRATAHLVLHAEPTRVTVNNGGTPETTATIHIRDLTSAKENGGTNAAVP